jgi:hypothetical protein
MAPMRLDCDPFEALSFFPLSLAAADRRAQTSTGDLSQQPWWRPRMTDFDHSTIARTRLGRQRWFQADRCPRRFNALDRYVFPERGPLAPVSLLHVSKHTRIQTKLARGSFPPRSIPAPLLPHRAHIPRTDWGYHLTPAPGAPGTVPALARHGRRSALAFK